MKDVTVRYSHYLKAQRVLPVHYKSGFLQLTEACLDYFVKNPIFDEMYMSGEAGLPSVGHCSGLVTYEDKELKRVEREEKLLSQIREEDVKQFIGDKARFEQEYFLIEGYHYDDWKSELQDNMGKVHRLLSERYKNKLPIKGIRKFYHTIEVSCYVCGYEIDALSIDVRAGNSMKNHYFCPSIDIAARSTDGKEKACKAECDRLSALVKELFDVSSVSKHRSIDSY